MRTAGLRRSVCGKLLFLRCGAAGGVCCGAVLFTASAFQQAGIGYTSVGKAGFITALYIVLVPLTGVLIGRRISAALWAGVALAVAGMYLLCMTGETGVNKGDVLCLACASSHGRRGPGTACASKAGLAKTGLSSRREAFKHSYNSFLSLVFSIDKRLGQAYKL